MKIVYIYDALILTGGVERIFTYKMNYLAEAYGYEVYLITSSQGTHPLSYPLSEKVKHIDLGIRFHLQYQYPLYKRIWVRKQMDKTFDKRLKETISDINPDIIIGTPYHKGDTICQLKCKARKIIESHSPKFYTGLNDGIKRNIFIQWPHNIMHKRSMRCIEQKADVIVTLTSGDANEWQRAKKVCIIPNITTFSSEKKSSCETQRVIYAGRYAYEKRLDKLIEAWKLVHQKHPNWKLDMFGDGPLKAILNELIKKNKLSDVVTIHPPTQEIAKEFCQSSIFVLSSRYEGFGLVLIEAMSCGVPCISFDCPYGPRDIIKDKENGLIIENGNIRKLAEAICYLIENERIRKDYGKKAAENIKRFQPDQIMPLWIKLFNELKRDK